MFVMTNSTNVLHVNKLRDQCELFYEKSFKVELNLYDCVRQSEEVRHRTRCRILYYRQFWLMSYMSNKSKNCSLSSFDFMTLSDIEWRFDIEVNVGNARNCVHYSSTVCLVDWNVSWVSISISSKLQFHLTIYFIPVCYLSI